MDSCSAGLLGMRLSALMSLEESLFCFPIWEVVLLDVEF